MKLGVIGCGKMASALVEGAINAGALAPADVVACNRSASGLAAFIKATGATPAKDATEIGGKCDTILLATKPYDVLAVLAQAAEGANGQPRLAISIAAGLTLTTLEDAAPETFRLIRTMPNTPVMVGKGATAFSTGSRATADDAEAVRRLLGAVGLVFEMPEKLIDSVSGVSGSGPAYIYLVIEAMADGGVKAGLARADAIRLAAQTVFGAAAMVLETGLHPAVLKDQVTSPGGTTIAALAELERNGVRSAFIDAIGAAVRRAGEMGKA